MINPCLSLFFFNDEYIYIRILFVNNCFAVWRVDLKQIYWPPTHQLYKLYKLSIYINKKCNYKGLILIILKFT